VVNDLYLTSGVFLEWTVVNWKGSGSKLEVYGISSA